MMNELSGVPCKLRFELSSCGTGRHDLKSSGMMIDCVRVSGDVTNAISLSEFKL
jgi:hypothetical protein